MKCKAVMTVVVAMSTTLAGVALAQPNGYTGNEGGPQYRDQNHDRNQNQNRDRNRANEGRRGPSQVRHGIVNLSGANDGNDEPGAGPEHSFHRGGRLPSEYRNHQYVVDDWRDHHLSAPPRGYQWVQTGGDYVLVAIATGIIAQVLLGH